MISPVKIWRRQKETRKLLGKEGIIMTWTIIYVTGSEFKKFAPYPVVIAKLNNGDKVTASLVDYEKEDLKMGRKIKVVLRKVRESGQEDILVYGPKLKPI